MNALLIFLVIVILVTAVLVYLYFNKLGPWKKEKSPASAQTPAQTQVLPSITDFSVDRTLSPDGSSEPYTIEPYTIEPYTAEDIKKLSNNVTFTLKWTNGSGFEEAGVNKIEVYHSVKNVETSPPTSFDSNGKWIPSWILRKTVNDKSDLKNFKEDVTTSINGLEGVVTPYSFEGTNFFKIVAYYGTNGSNDIELYNSYTINLAVEISNGELVGTLDMTSPETVTYKPRLDSGKGQSLGKEISNKLYNFYYFENVPQSEDTEGGGKSLFENVRLVPVDDEGTQFKLEKGGEYFKVSGTGYLFGDIDNDISNASTVFIAESQEQKINKRGYEKVILLKVLIGNESESYYLFGKDGFKKLNDPNISSADQFFRRNIYINSV